VQDVPVIESSSAGSTTCSREERLDEVPSLADSRSTLSSIDNIRADEVATSRSTRSSIENIKSSEVGSVNQSAVEDEKEEDVVREKEVLQAKCQMLDAKLN